MTQYAVIKIRNAYMPDLQGLSRPVVVESGLTLDEAKAKVNELDGETYCTMHGEAGAPEYHIIEGYYNDGENVGYQDGGDYDWDEIECDHPENATDGGDKCGECQSCIQGMIDQDQEYVRGLAK